ncbi:MAG TPA: 4Fe-4S binding protein, partial [Nitrospiria bacterium]|nr:4Fe-4S binding protein [Nitrospiria bacterium]
DKERNTAFVSVDRCKGCMQCVWVCDTMARHHAIKMVMIDELPKVFAITAADMHYEAAHLLKPAAINLPHAVPQGVNK